MSDSLNPLEPQRSSNHPGGAPGHAAGRLRRLIHRIGQAQTRLILTAFYFTLLMPAALLFRLLADPLHLRARSRPTWCAKSKPEDLWKWGRAQS